MTVMHTNWLDQAVCSYIDEYRHSQGIQLVETSVQENLNEIKRHHLFLSIPV